MHGSAYVSQSTVLVIEPEDGVTSTENHVYYFAYNEDGAYTGSVGDYAWSGGAIVGRSVGPPPCRSVSVSAPPVENIVIVGSDGGGLGAALAWASVSADMHLGIQLVLFVA